MRKFTLSGFIALAFICMAVFASAQDGPRDLPGPNKSLCFSKDYVAPGTDAITSVFSEDFSGGVPPTGWEIIGLGQTNWLVGASNNAGGIAPEVQFSWDPSFNGNSKMVTPEINTSGYSVLAFQFKHFLDDYSGNAYSLKIETTTDGSTWNEVWSVTPTGNIGPEVVTLMLDDGIGSETFQIAITFDGNSYNLDFWYVDDVILFEALSYDAEAAGIFIPAQIPVGVVVEPAAQVRNMGTETVTFDVTFELLDGGTAVYSSTYTVTDLEAFSSTNVTFDIWTAVLGDYVAEVTVFLAGDENPDNDMVSKDVQVLDGMVYKKQLYEEFTSATCAPCAAANPIIDSILGDNPDEYSLIKYQMDWPGSGDIYYTEQGGDRKDYYGVTFVPDLYCNATNIYPAGSLTQAIFDDFAEQVTAMEIEVVSSINENGIITVDATLNSNANYPAGMKAHIVVVEKTTVGNVGTNGEEEFYNVMMIMLPGSGGTTLEAISQGGTVELSESFDMTETNMEEPTDLAVIVFVQDDSDKTVIQSEMVDVEAGGFVTFDVTFNVEDSDGNAVEGAEIFMEGQGSMTTNASGVAVYEDVFPGTWDYDVSKGGLLPVSGTVEVTDEDVTVDVVMEIPEYYFFEDFGENIPADWTTHATNPDFLYWYDGKVIFFDQTTAENPILLVTPEMIMSEIGTVIIEVGEAYQDPNVILGTVTDPSDPTTFTGIETFAVGSDWEEFTVDWSAYTGTDTYIGLMYDGPQSGFFSLNTVKMTGAGAPPVGDAWETFEDYTAGDYLVAQANSMGRDYWTTWSNSPGSAEDPMVSSDQAYAGSNSLVIEGTNDAVLLFDDITEGIWAVSFRIFVPTDYFGYFNLLQEFAGSSSQWGMQAYFDAGGIGTVDAGGAGAGTFNYSYDTWIFVEVVVDLDDDWAQMIVDGNSIVEWQWSTGSFGTGTLNQLGAMNLYAWNANGTPKAYFDDIDLQEFMMAEIFEDFETYNSGEQLVEQAVAQGIDYWTTWSNSPGSAEDPYISSDVSQSGNNSVVIEGTNDAVLLFGNKTSGAYTVFFGIYVPSGFYGYFNLLQDFAGTSSQWGAQCYFDAGGIGTIDAGGAGAGVFNYNYDEWVHVKVDVDLDTDWADIYINDALIISWQWSTGTFGTGTLNQLSAMNLWAWGDNGTPKAYFDDIALIEKTPPVAVEEITVTQQFQIYPNPATTLLNIESPEEMIGVRIMNQMGQLVFSNTQNGTKLTLNISDFERGVYFVIISTNNKQNITQKLVIN